jgi:hypothetical protein
MTYPTTFGTIPTEWSLGPQTIPVYATLAALGLEQNVIPAGAMAAVQNPQFALYQAIIGTQPASYAVSSLSSSQIAGGGETAYWVPLGTGSTSNAVSFTARAVVTSLAAYNGTGTNVLTGSANGAIAAQDGVTLAVGDQILIQAGTTHVTAADSGPWTVTQIGTASTPYILTRPTWFSTASTFTSGRTITVGGEGTIFSNTEWFISAAAGVVGTNSPAFYCRSVTVEAILSGGTLALAAGQPGSGNFPVGALAGKCNLLVSLQLAGGSPTGTVSYGMKGITPGLVGTATASVFAFATALATQSGDTSTLNVTIVNVG